MGGKGKSGRADSQAVGTFPYFWDSSPLAASISEDAPERLKQADQPCDAPGRISIGFRNDPPQDHLRELNSLVASAHSKRTQVLLVSDYISSLVSTARLLRLLGYACTTAESGGEARELARAERFDVLVTDSQLPDVHVCVLIQEFACDYNLPAVIIFDSLPLTAELKLPAWAPVLVKPVEGNHIHRAIQRALSH